MLYSVFVYLIHPILDTRISIHPDFSVLVPSVTLRVPPWILKRGGLGSSGQRLISSIGKNKRILFIFFVFDNYFLLSKCLDFFKTNDFLELFFRFVQFFSSQFGLNCRALVELGIPNIKKKKKRIYFLLFCRKRYFF